MFAYILIFIMGLVVGMAIALVITYHPEVGNLVVDRSDQDGPFFFLELEKTPEVFEKNKKIILKIKNKNYFN